MIYVPFEQNLSHIHLKTVPPHSHAWLSAIQTHYLEKKKKRCVRGKQAGESGRTALHLQPRRASEQLLPSSHLMNGQAGRERTFLPCPADYRIWVAVGPTLQRDRFTSGDMLLWRREGPDGGGKLHVQGVLQLDGRLHIEETKEGASISRPRVGYGEARSFNVKSSVACHLLAPYRQQPFLAPQRRLLLDDQLVVS